MTRDHVLVDSIDEPLCGDPTYEGPGCRQSAIDAYYERQQDAAREIVRDMLGLPRAASR